jgi:hypothetical protein
MSITSGIKAANNGIFWEKGQGFPYLDREIRNINIFWYAGFPCVCLAINELMEELELEHKAEE